MLKFSSLIPRRIQDIYLHKSSSSFTSMAPLYSTPHTTKYHAWRPESELPQNYCNLFEIVTADQWWIWIWSEKFEFGVRNLNLEWEIWIWSEKFEFGVMNLNLEWWIWIWSKEFEFEVRNLNLIYDLLMTFALVGHRTFGLILNLSPRLH